MNSNPRFNSSETRHQICAVKVHGLVFFPWKRLKTGAAVFSMKHANLQISHMLMLPILHSSPCETAAPG